MRQKHGTQKPSAEKVMKDIRRRIRKQCSAKEKIRIVLEGLRGEESITEHCPREGIATSLYCSWSKEFLKAGKKRLTGDTARQATSPGVKELRAEAVALKGRSLKSRSRTDCSKKHDRGWRRLGMRYPASEKLEMIRLVEQIPGRGPELPVPRIQAK